VSELKPFNLEAAQRGELFFLLANPACHLRFIGVRQSNEVFYETPSGMLYAAPASDLCMVEDAPKPFDLDAALRGEAVVVVNSEAPNEYTPVYFIGPTKSGKRFVVEKADGTLLDFSANVLRMAPKPKPKTHYLNVYRDADGTPEAGLYFYPSQEAADKNAREDRHRITTLSFTDTE
jgi:hypothetical protein